MGMSAWDFIDGITELSKVAVILGFFIGLRQLRLNTRTSKAHLLVHFNEQWRSEEIYTSVCYMHELRRSWMRQGGKLEELARDWVDQNAPGSTTTADWLHRRCIAQYLRHVGFLLVNKHLTADDVFSTFPEARRVLETLIPIENAIADHFPRPKNPSGPWDRSAIKWELDEIIKAYDKWYRKEGKKLFTPHRLDMFPTEYPVSGL
jgi:hypothetical protein